MLMDIVVKVSKDVVLNAADKAREIPCLRFNCEFEYMNGAWRNQYSCNGYGNGLGTGFSCKENCRLRITDLSKCVSHTPYKNIDQEYSYMIQHEYFGQFQD